MQKFVFEFAYFLYTKVSHIFIVDIWPLWFKYLDAKDILPVHFRIIPLLLHVCYNRSLISVSRHQISYLCTQYHNLNRFFMSSGMPLVNLAWVLSQTKWHWDCHSIVLLFLVSFFFFFLLSISSSLLFPSINFNVNQCSCCTFI